MKRLTVLVPLASFALLIALVAPPGAAAPAGGATSALVTVASPQNLHPRNAQNEPALAVDASRPRVLAAGANELIDMQPCSEEASTTSGACSFPLGTFNLGVGLTGIYFSFDRGRHWTQPTYQGLTAANCDPTVEPCEPEPGPIHTIPNYYEAGLRTRSDPAVAFGPAPDANGDFSWSNGSRLYAATLATNLTDTVIQQGGGQNSTFAVTASFIDNITPARVADQANWSQPYFVAPHVAETAGLDKEQIWADYASSSAFFGNAFVCYSDFHSFSGGNAFPLKLYVSRSTDGGVTWTRQQVLPASANFPQGSHQGCTVRTDSNGVVYAFFTHFAVGQPGLGSHTMVKSFDGGVTWTDPQEVVSMNDECYQIEPLEGRCVADGIAGARIDLAAMPSVDIANGAPTGADATNEIVDAWADGRLGEGNEAAFVSYSTDGGDTWSDPVPISAAGERVIYAAPGIAPDGSRVYVAYMAIRKAYQTTTAATRPEHGAFMSASIGAGGAPGGWAYLYSGPFGDIRGTSQGRILYNEFLGDYVYVIGTRTYGAGVWTEVRRTQDCPAMDQWRQDSYDAGTKVFPAPWPLGDCPDRFGNNDIFSATTG
jgi:hypothetical protein